MPVNDYRRSVTHVYYAYFFLCSRCRVIQRTFDFGFYFESHTHIHEYPHDIRNTLNY